MTATIRVRKGNIAKHLVSKGWNNSQLADATGVAESTVSRVLNGFQAPGEKFIAGLLAAFPHLDFSDLFEVITTEKLTA